MKLSISLPAEDLSRLDEYARTAGIQTRSAAVREAIRLLRHLDLEQEYATAWDEWESSGDAEAWASTAADGVADAAR